MPSLLVSNGAGNRVAPSASKSTAAACSYGFAYLKRGAPVTSASVFDIGSVSKQITAAVVYLLVADHVMSLHDGVRTWVPELPDTA